QVLSSGVENSGTAPSMMLQRFDPNRPNPNRETVPRERSRDAYIIAAKITGVPPEDEAALAAALQEEEEKDPADDPALDENADAKKEEKKMNVTVVADIDWIIPSFFYIREGGEDFLPATQNVTFILNVIDELAGDKRFLDIR